MEIMQPNVKQFKIAMLELLSPFNIRILRLVGRHFGLRSPTDMCKADLIELIISVNCGEVLESRSKRGAPLKDNRDVSKIVQAVLELKDKYLFTGFTDCIEAMIEDVMREFPEKPKPEVIELHDFIGEDGEIETPDFYELLYIKQDEEEIKEDAPPVYIPIRKILRGQLEYCERLAYLLPEDGRVLEGKIYVPLETVRKFDMREGDVVTCYAFQRAKTLVAAKILTINEKSVHESNPLRAHFDDCEVCEPHKSLQFIKTGINDKVPVAAKCVDWILPLLKGQRACVRSAPKAGKTHFIYDLAMAAHGQENLRSFVLLLDQSLETVSRFRKLLPHTELIYTTYETDCDKQVYAAQYLLKRAKRYVESGYDVLLIVDSLNALARAYNETPESVGGKVLTGGLESKTLQYLKKYFGTSRCLENGGSLTMLCALAEDTGNPADDIIASEMLSLCNYEIALSETLAQRRIYPSIDYKKSRSNFEPQAEEQKAIRKFMLEEFPYGNGEEKLNEILSVAETISNLQQALKID